MSDLATPANNSPQLSLVVPGYNEEKSFPLFYAEAARVLTSMREQNATFGAEIIFVDDGSTDGSAAVLCDLARQDPRVRYLILSRNFGKEAAMLAGLRAARGKFVAILDADLQHPPALLPEMLASISAGDWDCVAARRTRAGDAASRSFLARNFYRVMSRLTGMKMLDGVGDFRLMTRQYVDAMLSLPERNRFSKGLFPWIGFRVRCLDYENAPRAAGETKWSLVQLFRYSLDGITGFSTQLLSLSAIGGAVVCSFSFAVFAITLIGKFFGLNPVDGVPTIICLLSFLGGVQLFAIGILGEYIGKIYTEVKSRPSYIVREQSADE